jgi:hypothetical protein
MGLALGRWQQVLVEALAEHKAVGVRAVVVSHLGREATRADESSQMGGGKSGGIKTMVATRNVPPLWFSPAAWWPPKLTTGLGADPSSSSAGSRGAPPPPCGCFRDAPR